MLPIVRKHDGNENGSRLPWVAGFTQAVSFLRASTGGTQQDVTCQKRHRGPNRNDHHDSNKWLEQHSFWIDS